MNEIRLQCFYCTTSTNGFFRHITVRKRTPKIKTIAVADKAVKPRCN